MDEEVCLAHIRYENGKPVVQTLLEHLLGTEELAVSFSAPFHAEKDASLAALSHDIGKAAEILQHSGSDLLSSGDYKHSTA